MYESAQLLDRAFGDPNDGHNPFGFRASVARDEHGVFPTALRAAAQEAGLHTCYLPGQSFDEALVRVRTAARRDVALMPSVMISITALWTVLVGGSPEQRRRVTDLVALGGTVAFAMSEEDSGSDVLAGTCRLEKDGDDFLLYGEKWLVALGSRCDALLVVARTGERGPGAFTAVLLDRAALPAGTAEVSDPVPTTGMRGIDFVRYRFTGCPVPADAVIGAVGTGLDAAMRAQQVVRAMSAAGNLACADTALRVVLDFALERTVGRTPLVEVPHARSELAAAAAALLAADVSALTTARALHVAPERFVVPSSVVKRVAMAGSARIVDRCAAVLGARSVLAGGPTGIVQKAKRDNEVIRYFDTSPIGNLRTIVAQLPLVARADRTVHDGLANVFDLGRDLPPLTPSALDLSARGHDDVTAGLPEIATLTSKALTEQGDSRAAELVVAVDHDLTELLADVRTGASVEQAAEFCRLHAAASAVHLWWFNRDRELFGEPAGSADWLTGGLPGGDPAAALEVVLRLHERNRLFSAVPVPLADQTRGE